MVKLANFLQLIGTIKETVFKKVRTETVLNALDNTVITLDVMKLNINCIIYPTKTKGSTFVCSMQLEKIRTIN